MMFSLVGTKKRYVVIKKHRYNYVSSIEFKEILHSMEKLQSRGLTPFLSPMLEDEPGPKYRKEDESLELIREKNFRKIQQCIDYVSQQVQNEEERAIAIKLTAFIPISTLVK